MTVTIAFNVAQPSPDILSADEFHLSRRGTHYGADTDWYELITRVCTTRHKPI